MTDPTVTGVRDALKAAAARAQAVRLAAEAAAEQIRAERDARQGDQGDATDVRGK